MKKRLPNFNDVKPYCEGNWSSIFSYLVGPSIQPALKKRPNHAPCPVNGGSDSFRLYRDFDTTGGGYSNKVGRGFNDGFNLLAWILDLKPLDVLNLIAEYYNLVDSEGRLEAHTNRIQLTPQPSKPKKEIPSEDNREKLNKLWQQSQYLIDGANDNPILHYFRNRGINLAKMPTCFNEHALRFHPKLAYYEQVHGESYPVKCHGKFPTLVSMVSDCSNNATTIHRTYLTDKGVKADVPYPKKIMSSILKGNTQGSSVKLFIPEGCSLGLAEGIETALSVAQVTQMPVWSTLHTEGLKSVQIPDHVTHIFIWADKDRICNAHPEGAGYEAAVVLQTRLQNEGKHVQILMPRFDIPENQKSLDWLDVLNNFGEYYFPIINRQYNKRPDDILEQAS